jgi:hypothetical protein
MALPAEALGFGQRNVQTYLATAQARVAESVYAADLKSAARKGYVGSSPTPGIPRDHEAP